MRWFGEYWDAPLCDSTEHIGTPVGAPCAWCGELIEPGDRGVVVSVITDRPPFEHAFHRECFARESMGSIAHLERRCSCYIAGAEESDPPGVTPRESARAVWQAITGMPV